MPCPYNVTSQPIENRHHNFTPRVQSPPRATAPPIVRREAVWFAVFKLKSIYIVSGYIGITPYMSKLASLQLPRKLIIPMQPDLILHIRSHHSGYAVTRNQSTALWEQSGWD